MSLSLRYGVVSSLGSGVCSINGLILAFVGQVYDIRLMTSTSSGLVVNLTRDTTNNLIVSSLLFNPTDRISVGGLVTGRPSLASLVLGDFLLGGMLDPLGNVLLQSSTVSSEYAWLIESPSIGLIDRQSVFEPLQSGLLSIDAMVPVGRGQRELILGDRYTGKTSIGVDFILNQRYEKSVCVYAAIGQKASSILEVFLSLIARGALDYIVILVASSSVSSVSQYLSGYTGCAICDFFMLVRQLGSLLFLDDLSKHAVAYREIYLLLRRPPGREAYPGEIFFVHSRLLERSALLSASLGGGSSTALPVIETLGGDVSAYITTNVISITDGQLFLSVDLFLSGIRPAIDVGLSVTRVGSAAQWDGMKLVGGSYKLQLAQYAELQSFSQFSGDLGSDTKARLLSGASLVELFKQVNGSPLSLSYQLSLLSVVSQSILERLSLDRITLFVSYFTSVPSWVFCCLPTFYLGLSITRLNMTSASSSSSA
jgi:F-type H+-transporting ATPase subunit alpha